MLENEKKNRNPKTQAVKKKTDIERHVCFFLTFFSRFVENAIVCCVFALKIFFFVSKYRLFLFSKRQRFFC
jgi:hypothetical protein